MLDAAVRAVCAASPKWTTSPLPDCAGEYDHPLPPDSPEQEQALPFLEAALEVLLDLSAGRDTEGAADRLAAAADALEKVAREFIVGDNGDGNDAPATLPELGPHDKEAWQASLVVGMTQSKIAEMLSRTYPGETWTQPRVSEAIKRAKAHTNASGLTDKLPASGSRAPARTLDPAASELGKRTDGKAHHLRERERQKAKDGGDDHDDDK
jgi:hypothetical protein